MSAPRVWLVTAKTDRFIDQRRIEAFSQSQAENYAYDWIRSVGGDVSRSSVEEVTRERS